MPSTNTKWSELLHQTKDAPALQQFIDDLSEENAPEPTIKTFKDATYRSWPTLGISFCFTIANGEEQLDSIDIFNGRPQDKFSVYCGEHPLGLSSSSKAHEIVSALGEPIKKGGGGNTRMPCWVQYDTDQGFSVQVNLDGVHWEDREMSWTSMAIFED
ncbi:hypothetical protein INT43_004642 [Umbelopsis isabellina]|uniref:Uncharacterized protein n=1 Tax=Mortierella isabellina TaxID=91625 RepID=A0A8H7PG44_MORIS|nr:hypothetical protein INT43_004642 [Umbelopsis isabellina]